VTRFHTENANLHTSIFGIIMNLDRWKKLPPEIQEAIEGVSGLTAAELFGRVFDGTDEETIQFMKNKGDIFLRLSEQEKKEWREILDVIISDWLRKQEARGLPGREILETALRLKEKYSLQGRESAAAKIPQQPALELEEDPRVLQENVNDR